MTKQRAFPHYSSETGPSGQRHTPPPPPPLRQVWVGLARSQHRRRSSVAEREDAEPSKRRRFLGFGSGDGVAPGDSRGLFVCGERSRGGDAVLDLLMLLESPALMGDKR